MIIAIIILKIKGLKHPNSFLYLSLKEEILNQTNQLSIIKYQVSITH